MKYELDTVTERPELWCNEDPVRPELGADFKTKPGRGVFGLRKGETYVAFLCYALTTGVPKNVTQLDFMTAKDGPVAVPYTVWSREKGAGKRIVRKVIENVRDTGMAERVVTLSPLTEMARRFHLRNGAKELQVNEDTVNFEYQVKVT